MELMVDIETLGSTPDGAIISIAAVVFNYRLDNCQVNLHVDKVFHESLMISDTLRYGKVDPETLKFWYTQPRDNFDRSAIFEYFNTPIGKGTNDDRTRHDVRSSFTRFMSFISSITHITKVWSNSPSFDLVILDHYYHQIPKIAKKAHIIDFRLWSDVRTLKQLVMPNINTNEEVIEQYETHFENVLSHLIHHCSDRGLLNLHSSNSLFTRYDFKHHPMWDCLVQIVDVCLMRSCLQFQMFDVTTPVKFSGQDAW